MKRFLAIISIMLVLLSAAYGKVIATATLRIRLVVPPRRITPETEEGRYDGYSVARDGDARLISVTAV